MTRIVICCDGTWNSPSIPETTSVFKLSQALTSDPKTGQVVAYFKGIGTDERFDGPIKRFLNHYGGGAFGWGLDAKVKQAYQFICQAYSRGDSIYLFGFSRGAYTARSVAGLIRKCGILKDASVEGVNEAYKLYRKRGKANAPDQPHVRKARRALSPHFATSTEDVEWRDDGSTLVDIAYMGVWDTVGAKGIPVSLFGPVAAAWNRQYKFHDMQLSRLVRSARHVLAVDERRIFFKPAKWDNVDVPGGLNGTDFGPDRQYQQLWFAGVHSDVGGSGTAQGLAAIALDWIAEGAGDLTYRADANWPPGGPDAVIDDVMPERGLLARWRTGPDEDWQMHGSVRQRWNKRTDWRPKCLEKMFPSQASVPSGMMHPEPPR